MVVHVISWELRKTAWSGTRDVQASSILLDDKYEVRLGSLSEVCAQEGDSYQSRMPRFLRLPQSSEQGSSGAELGSHGEILTLEYSRL